MTKPLQERIHGGGGGGGDYAGFKGMGMSELEQKSKPGVRVRPISHSLPYSGTSI